VTEADTGKKTLNDEITEAVNVVSATLESAERVAALRADKGKPLSRVNASGLADLARILGALQKRAQALAGRDAPDEITSFREKLKQIDA
jgi:hypothetical protein